MCKFSILKILSRSPTTATEKINVNRREKLKRKSVRGEPEEGKSESKHETDFSAAAELFAFCTRSHDREVDRISRESLSAAGERCENRLCNSHS